jgi:hypothetical protein
VANEPPSDTRPCPGCGQPITGPFRNCRSCWEEERRNASERTVADVLADALAIFMLNDCARLDVTEDEWKQAERAMELYLNG